MHRFTTALISFGPWGVLVLSLLDSVGIPIPAAVDFLLITIAVDSVKMHAPGHAYFAALMAVLGSVAGNLILFSAARHGRRLFGGSEPSSGKGRRFQQWFRRYGMLCVFVPAVTPVVPLPLKVFVISAGALHTSTGRFLAIIVIARVIRYFGEAWLGVQLGTDAKGFLIRHGWAIAGAALAISFALFFAIRWSDRMRQEGDGSAKSL